MDALLQDLRYAVRLLVRAPTFAVIAILMLALGIGINTTIFSLANAIMFRPLPFQEPEQLVALNASNARLEWTQAVVSYPTYTDWKERSRSFERMGAYQEVGFNLSGGDSPERLSAAVTSHDLFEVLGVRPAAGRTFRPEEDRPGADRVVILGHVLWERLFDARSDAIGRTVKLDGETFTVVGIMPAEFAFPEFAALWVPLSVGVDHTDRGARMLSVLARLRDGVTIEAAREEMEGISGQLAAAYPDIYPGWGVNARPYATARQDGMAPLMFTLLGAVAFVLLIACANVGNLMLVRITARQRELTLRAVLGATRMRLVQQLLMESVLLALAGGALGVVLALWGMDVIFAALPADLPLPYWLRLDLDPRVLAYTFAASTLCVVFVGLASTLQTSRPDLAESLKQTGTRGSTARRSRLRNGLVVGEVAVSLVLLLGAGLMIRSFLGIQRIGSGLDSPDQVLTLRVTLPESKYAESAQTAQFFERLLDDVRRLPGVAAAGAFGAESRPAPGGADGGLALEGRAPLPAEEASSLFYRSVSPGYFEAAGMRLVRGRGLTGQDRAGAPAAVVINEAMARRFWPGEDPVGRQLRLGADQARPWAIVVGVARDVNDARITGSGVRSAARPEIFFSSLQEPVRVMTLAVRSGPDPLRLADNVRAAVLAIDPDQPVSWIMTLEEWLAMLTAPFRWMALLFAVFGVLALGLATIGIYGVVAYSVEQRTQEIGTRMSLGARPGNVVRMVVKEGMRLVLMGLGIGLLAGLALTRVLRMILFEVSPTDPVTYAAVAAVLAGAAALASWLPARRATAVDPMVALRRE